MRTGDSTDRRELGGLWRDVVNFLGGGPVTPGLLVPLLDAVVPGWASWTYFLRQLSRKLVDAEDRAQIEYEVACARIGHRLWAEQREQLAVWAAGAEGGPITDDQLASWWFGDRRDLLVLDEQTRLTQFLKLITFTAEEVPIIDRLTDPKRRDLVIYRLREHLHWLNELETLRELSMKTWPADSRLRRGWTTEELSWVNGYYADQAPEVSAEIRNGVIDPMELESISNEDNLGFGMTDLGYSMYVLMRAAVIDFIDELLEATRFPKVRGSLRCIDCGQFAGRRALGYGQFYCSERCKKRAAKRRYRMRARKFEPRQRPAQVPPMTSELDGSTAGQLDRVGMTPKLSRSSERLRA
jgi:hypothetical protein